MSSTPGISAGAHRGRNGGFCVPGGSGLYGKRLVDRVGADAAREFCRASVAGVRLVEALAESEGLDICRQGDGELQVAHTSKAFDALRQSQDVASSILGLDYQLLSREDVRERYYDSSEQFGGLLVRPGFGLHPLRYCRGLAVAAAMRGATLHEHSRVLDWHRDEAGRHRLATAGGELRARRVIVACNGFLDEAMFPALYARTMPIISAIVVTRPLSDTELVAQPWRTETPAANTRRVLNYYRLLPDRRFLFGGRGRSTGHAGAERETYRRLQRQLHAIWPEWRAVDIEYRWQGLICYTASLFPSVGPLADDATTWFAYGYHGNGVNMATWTGKQLARWIAGGDAGRIPAMMRGVGQRFPLPRLRLRYLGAAIAAAAFVDRWR